LILPVDTAAHFGGGLLGLIIGAYFAWRHNTVRAHLDRPPSANGDGALT